MRGLRAQKEEEGTPNETTEIEFEGEAKDRAQRNREFCIKAMHHVKVEVKYFDGTDDFQKRVIT